MKHIIYILVLIVFSSVVYSQSNPTLEERVEELERKVLYLMSIIESQSISGSSSSVEVILPRITVEILELEFNKSDSNNNWANDFQDWLSLSFKFTNNLEKEIRAAKGTIVFKDLFGDPWWEINLAINDLLPSKESFIWTGRINYNNFSTEMQRAKNTDPKDVIVEYRVTNILFTDGTTFKNE
jgi:hypothetical protein